MAARPSHRYLPARDFAPHTVYVWVLIWGGGDEPENPSVTIHRTKGGALQGARDMLASIGTAGCARPAGEVIDDLRALGEADQAGANDAFMQLYPLTIGD